MILCQHKLLKFRRGHPEGREPSRVRCRPNQKMWNHRVYVLISGFNWFGGSFRSTHTPLSLVTKLSHPKFRKTNVTSLKTYQRSLVRCDCEGPGHESRDLSIKGFSRVNQGSPLVKKGGS